MKTRIGQARLGVLLLLTILVMGCGGSTNDTVPIEVSFDTLARSAQPIRVEVFLLESCEPVSMGQTPDDPIASSYAVRDGTTGPRLGRLPPGEYGLYALARDESCFVVAAGCVPVSIGTAAQDSLTIELGGFAGEGCPIDELCDSEVGRCVGPDTHTDDCRSRVDETPCALEGAVGLCRMGSCCTGCWDGSTCHAGNDDVRCGAAGGACRLCECATDTCEQGACVPSVPVLEIDMGSEHACAVADDGGLFCWGSRQRGALGIGSSDPPTCGADECTAPTRVAAPLPDSTWSGISAGEGVTCAISADDASLWCWGSNDDGRLGAPEAVPSTDQPMLIGDDAHVAVDNEAGNGCAIRAADKSLWCWGSNASGQVGQGTSGADVYEPREVPYGSGWDDVSIGDGFVLAIDGQRFWGWGTNFDGQLGTGETGGTTHPDLTGFVGSTVEAGSGSACALDLTGVGHCWGENRRGQLGIGTASGVDVSTPTPIAGAHAFDQFAVGSDSACAVTTAGALYCWGRNRFSQLGVGATSSDLDQADEPMRVGADSDWTQVAVGRESACAIRDNGSLWCWGRNDRGQLGLGDTDDRMSPARLCF